MAQDQNSSSKPKVSKAASSEPSASRSQRNPRAAASPQNWQELKEAPVQPKGPAKPWPGEMTDAAEEFVGFLKDPKSKRALTDFIVDAYKQFEAERINQFQARLHHEHEVDRRGADEHHQPGNITPIVSKSLNMHDTEKAFARGIRATKNNLVRSVEDRVEEINNLLAGIGGFSSQLKSCFARSTVVFLEQEDPQRWFRERLIFSINLPNYELKRSWKADDEPEVSRPKAKAPQAGKKGEAIPHEDKRTTLQATWDDAVNALAQIVASTGLKPKYVKNDRHFGRFTMKQDLRSSATLPDEYFSFTLDYNTQEKIGEMCGPYNKIVSEYEAKIQKLEKKLKGYPPNSHSLRYQSLKKKYQDLVLERDFFVGTTPDPNQLDEGLLFMIEVSTLKDYHIVKDRMQSIMTKYILHLSSIAMKEAEFDADLEYHMWKLGSKDAPAGGQPHAQQPAQGRQVYLTEEQIEQLPEYVVAEDGQLVPHKKKAA